jgi:pimeloyl-ACP methyl ester carboxylesterase
MDMAMYEGKIEEVAFVAGRWPLERDRPTIVFLHGSGGSRILWQRQVEALADAVNTVALDLPGHGDSGGEGMTRVEDYATAVSAFLDSIKAPRPVPCGLSIGGAIVLQLLLNSGERYDAGILVNTGARLRVMPLIFEALDNDYPGFIASIYTMGASEKTDPSRIRPIAEAMARCPVHVTRGDFAACNDFDVLERLQEIRVPVLVLTASEDKLTPGKYGAFLADRIPLASLVNIEDAGHLSPLEKPEEVSLAIGRFSGSIGTGKGQES